MSAVETMEQVGLPAGRYEATVKAVDVARHGKGRWHLDVVARLQRNGKTVIESRKLGAPDAYADMSESQRKTLRAMAKRLGVQHTGPVEEVIAAMQERKGDKVQARLRPSPLGVSVVFFGEPQEHVNGGVVLDKMPQAEPDYTERTVRAQGAHEQLLTGLHHAHRGLALAAQACHRLRLEEGWTAIGYESVGAYLASPEIGMSRSQFYSLADIWEQYIERGGQEETRLCAPSKLEVPLAALKAGEVTPDEALADAETLGLRDLRVKYRGEKEPSGRPERPPSYPFGCAHCGSLLSGPDDLVERHPE